LAKAGLLPAEMGWFPEKIHSGLDAVILGMHARAENSELLKAQELGVKVFSYPEYLYEQSKDKLRIVVGGSHGKTSITAMILHVLGVCKKDFDYMVGSQLAGFDTMVKVTADAPIMVLEGDEYLSSAIDRRPKFHLYKPDIALLSGIAWDHINVFPTFENYVEQFRIFVRQIPASGALIYCQEDEWVRSVSNDAVEGVKKLGYGIPANEIRDGITYLKTEIGEVPLQIFGDHNLMNLTGARLVCNQVGITDAEFYNAISSFKGAARRLEKIAESPKLIVFKDFAHSPSKLKATTEAVKAQYANRRVIACMELHTFSSLNSDFLAEYANSMNNPDVALVYYNPHTIAHKKLAPITPDQVKEAFGRKDLIVMNESSDVVNYLRDQVYDKAVLLLMSSGNFDGIDLNSFAKELADM
jgi:UDP-N-acetylmuramate: L-alanyl-gamma-D-glutamyl-meso-diaminopimelate ligase